jgi:4-amino-4-deoxy-L-arabinose transferase-like glycosyltransferase
VTLYQTIPLWIAAVVGALIAAWPRHDPHVPDELPATRWEVLLLIGLTLLALVLRLVNLRDIPFALHGDETIYAVEARSFNQLALFRPFTTALHGNWGMFYMILGTFMRLFGETVEGIRLHSVLFGTLTIVTTFALARALWGRRSALIAAALMTTYHFHIHFSRSAMANVYDTLFLTLVLGLIWLGWSTQRRRLWLLGALALGLAQCFYVGGRTILLLLAVMGLFWLITDRARVKAQALNIALAVGVFAVVVVPIFYFAYLRPDDYMTRFNQMLIIRNGWLEATMQAQQVGAAQVLWQQFSDTLRLFVIGSDGLFYRGQSLLTPVMTLLTAGGLLYLLRHIKEGRAFLIVSSVGLIILTAGVLTLGPGTSGHHYVATAPLIYITIAVFIDWGLRALERRGLRPRLAVILGTLLVIGLMIVDAYYYFGVFVPRRELVSNDVEPAMGLGAYLHQLEGQPKPPASVLCIRQPNISCRHSTVLFLAPQLSQAAGDLKAPPTSDDLNALPDEERIIIVAANLPDERALVQAHLPDVMPRDHYGIHGNVLFTSFEIPASQP